MRKDLVIAGWFASPGIRELIGLAFSVKEHPVWWGMKKEFEELDVALLRIHAFVEKIEKLQMIHYCTPEREAWLWQLKDAVDEANDVLDKLAYYKLKEDVKSGEEKVRATASGYTKKIIRSTAFAFKHAMHTKKKLKRAVKNLVHVADSVGDFLGFYDMYDMGGSGGSFENWEVWKQDLGVMEGTKESMNLQGIE
ncbi:putative disease resistance protein RGA3 [Cocos nucifera]|uniref:Putative disease resistance protein RGA3 n=1 Tax=Cocos nucifera TaxID=13894 RepID=A0A8K0IT66_COCNU|nr:putative disease resistance protein RGA3 [Cocos nucifera]